MTKRSWVFATVTALVIILSAVVFVIREEWLPLNSLLFRLSVLPTPEYDGVQFSMEGWGWYPLLYGSIDNKDGTKSTHFEYVRVDGWSNSVSTNITFKINKQGIPSEYISREETFPWGVARIIDAEKVPGRRKKINVAWIPNYNLYVGTDSESELQDALNSLRVIRKNSDKQ
jgi:hypothetical protein